MVVWQYPQTKFVGATCGGVGCEWIGPVDPTEAAAPVFFHMHGGGYYRGARWRLAAVGPLVAWLCVLLS